jgi:hypothetical protein
VSPELRRARRSALGKGSTLLALAVILGGCAHAKPLPPGEALTAKERDEAISRARVWSPVDVAKVDLKLGPKGPGSFAPNAWVDCEYKPQKDQSGRSPKFSCETSPGNTVKVKYGEANAEVFGEVLSTRLFWALGFAADRMYPVRVRCKGCPDEPSTDPKVAGKVMTFDPAAIERKLAGRAMETKTDSGWEWSELDNLAADAPASARAERDALKLLAAFVQHTDSKAANQRLLCPPGQDIGDKGCRRPILMVSDLGLTFGHAGLFIRNKNSVSLESWSEVPVWDEGEGCVAHLSGSLTGSLSSPKISEAGRAFLANLMVRLTDAQLKNLFESARVKRRAADPGGSHDDDWDLATVDGWVKAFKAKRAQIVDRRC